MKKNMGSYDRTIRVIIGLVVIALGVNFQSWWGLAGLIPIVTALIGWCPSYLPFGISTCKTEKSSN
jgi:predicted RND superfamily exporter protein